MKVLLAPNSFKGSISAVKIANVLEEAIKAKNKDIEVIKSPIADGGDGSIDVISNNFNVEVITTRVCDPLYRPIKANWLKFGDIAFIEAAAANGLKLLESKEYNPFITTTYGVGELILNAIGKKCTKIYLFVGGSSTNDAGVGALQALGINFLRGDKIFKIKNILDLSLVEKVDFSKLDENINNTNIIIACDVNNPLTGINGASYVYSEQKGAKEDDISKLDSVLANFAKIMSNLLNKDCQNLSGAGAAGGLAYGLVQLLNAKIDNGFDIISGLLNFEEKIKEADLIITGEGKLDYQSLSGKAPIRVAQLAKKHNKKCISISGCIDSAKQLEEYFDEIYSLSSIAKSTHSAIANPEKYLFDVINRYIFINEQGADSRQT